MSATMEICGVCESCHVLCKPLKCKGCISTVYCSKECQKSDWKTHKEHCQKESIMVSAKKKIGDWTTKLSSKENHEFLCIILTNILRNGHDGCIVEIYDLDLFVSKGIEESYIDYTGVKWRFCPVKKDELLNEMNDDPTNSSSLKNALSQNFVPVFIFKILLSTGGLLRQGMFVSQDFIEIVKNEMH